MTFRRIFVPGGNGFLGNRVVQKLKEKNLEVLSLSLRNGFDFRDFKSTRELFENGKFDAVINCAAFVGGIQFGCTRPGEIFFNNVSMCTNLMEASRLANVKRFVNPISNCTYPSHLAELKEDEWWNGPLHETVLAYGTAKKATWAQSWAYHLQYGFETVNLILPNMFGPGDHFDNVRSHALGALINKFMEAKRKNLPNVEVWGTGKPIREWLYVDDGAEALVKALDIDHVVDPINIGVGKGISMQKLAEMVKDIVGYEGSIVFDSSKPDGTSVKIMNVTKMKHIFKWIPQTNLSEGIRRTIEWYKEATS